MTDGKRYILVKNDQCDPALSGEFFSAKKWKDNSFRKAGIEEENHQGHSGYGDAQVIKTVVESKTDGMFAGFNEDSHKAHVAGDNGDRISVNGGGESFVIRNGKDQVTGSVGADMGAESGSIGFKPVAGLPAEIPGALCPVRNMMNIKGVKTLFGLTEPGFIQRNGGKECGTEGVRRHGLVMCSGTDGLQKAHWNGMLIGIDRKAVFIVTVDKSVRNSIIRTGQMVFIGAEKRAKRSVRA